MTCINDITLINNKNLKYESEHQLESKKGIKTPTKCRIVSWQLEKQHSDKEQRPNNDKIGKKATMNKKTTRSLKTTQNLKNDNKIEKAQ